MKRTILLCVLLSVVGVFSAAAQEPVTVGILNNFAGRVASFGTIGVQGAEIALEEINAEGGINGRRVRPLFMNTGLKPGVALKALDKLVNEQNADVVIGILTSGAAVRCAPMMPKYKVPLIATAAMTSLITGPRCNRYTFSTSWTIRQSTKSAALLASTRRGVNMWANIGPDYVFGHECWKQFKEYLTELNPAARFVPEDQAVFGSMGTTDWRPYIKQVIASGADGVFISLYGGNVVDLIRQGTELGLFDGNRIVLMNVASTMEVFLALGADLPEGLWVGSCYWYDAQPSDVNKRFVSAYTRKYGVPPSWMSYTSYAGLKIYAEAAKRAQSTDPDAIVRNLSGLEMELPAGNVLISPENHAAVFDMVWGKTSDQLGFMRRRLSFRTLDSFMFFTPEQLLTHIDSGCTMPAGE